MTIYDLSNNCKANFDANFCSIMNITYVLSKKFVRLKNQISIFTVTFSENTQFKIDIWNINFKLHLTTWWKIWVCSLHCPGVCLHMLKLRVHNIKSRFKHFIFSTEAPIMVYLIYPFRARFMWRYVLAYAIKQLLTSYFVFTISFLGIRWP